MDETTIDQQVEILDNALFPIPREWLNEDFPDYDSGIFFDKERTWETNDPGCYLWGISGGKVFAPAEYVGAAWSPGGIWKRISQHRNVQHRRECLENSRCLVYEYAEQVHGKRNRSSFIALGTFRRDALSMYDLKGWCLLLETAWVILRQTFAKETERDLPEFAVMWPEDRGISKRLGANRIPSIRKYAGYTETGGGGKDPIQEKVAKLVRVWKSQLQKITFNRLQKTEVIRKPSKEDCDGYGSTHLVMISGYTVGLHFQLLNRYGLHVGDKVTVTLDVVTGRHPHPWVKVPVDAYESATSVKLGISIFGISPKDGQPFGEWIERQRNNLVTGVDGHPSCNAAMSIIEWMRGEEIIPIPSNRVLMTKGNFRLSNYWGKETTNEGGRKLAHYEALEGSVSGKQVLEKFEAQKCVVSSKGGILKRNLTEDDSEKRVSKKRHRSKI